jgi:hypothetical protein
VDWEAEQTEASVRAGCLVMLDLVKQHFVQRVLNDNRKVQTMWSDVAEWGGTVWFPAMAEAGVEYFAWIYSPHQYTQRPMVLPFEDHDTAERWLRAIVASHAS